MAKLEQLTIPIVQGGMGIGISLDRLAGAVARRGGMGVLSSAYAGLHLPGFAERPRETTLRALPALLKKARERAGEHGLIGINIMCAVKDYREHVEAALAGGADAIISGAGLPKELPGMVGDAPVLLLPIVSGGRVTTLLCRYWQRHFSRLPDAVVLEGPAAGGHLGFAQEALRPEALPDWRHLLAEVRSALAPFEAAAGRAIPVIVAGGMASAQALREALAAGAHAVQIGTRFAATREGDAAQGFKERLVAAAAEDVTIVQSPVGMPGRALRSPLIERLRQGELLKPQRCYRCLTPCPYPETSYCISQALLAAARGDWENGLFFCGTDVGEIDRIETVDEVIDALLSEERL